MIKRERARAGSFVHPFRKGIRIQGWGRNLIFFQTTVPRADRLGLPAQGQRGRVAEDEYLAHIYP
jgi:hypothetical protein